MALTRRTLIGSAAALVATSIFPSSAKARCRCLRPIQSVRMASEGISIGRNDATLFFGFKLRNPDGSDRLVSLPVELRRTVLAPKNGNGDYLPGHEGNIEFHNNPAMIEQLGAVAQARGGVIAPMHNTEALYLRFPVDKEGNYYPMAVKVYAGGINAVTGEYETEPNATFDPDNQDYIVIHPSDPTLGMRWLDGFVNPKGGVNQFAAVPLETGLTAEQQKTGQAQMGGMQLIVAPMNPRLWQAMNPPRSSTTRAIGGNRGTKSVGGGEEPSMGIAPAGRLNQIVPRDPFVKAALDHLISPQDIWMGGDHALPVFVHMVDAQQWERISGQPIRRAALNALDYLRHNWADRNGRDVGPRNDKAWYDHLRYLWKNNFPGFRTALPPGNPITENAPVQQWGRPQQRNPN